MTLRSPFATVLSRVLKDLSLRVGLQPDGDRLKPVPRSTLFGARMLRLTLIAAALAAAVLTACNDGEPGPFADTPTVPVTDDFDGASPTPDDLQGVDFSAVTEVREFITVNGGEVDRDEIVFVDLTEDGVDEAIVPVSSGGTLGTLAVFVFTADEGGVRPVLQAAPLGTGGIAFSIEDGVLVTTEGVYGPDDPQCCPSQLVRRSYAWNGETLVVDEEETVDATRGAR
jgi:hypothetical protein